LRSGRDERLAERGEVRAAHRRVLAVDEGPVFLAVVVAVGERDLDVLALEVDDRVERLAAEFLGQQVLQAVRELEGLPIQREREAPVEEGVVPQHVLDELHAELEVLAEERLVRRELDERAVALGSSRGATGFLSLPFSNSTTFVSPSRMAWAR
jgi:hypothetical protein